MNGIQTFQSRPGIGQLFAENLAGGLGSAVGQGVGKGLGSLVGLGAEKLGITGPSQEEIDFMISQGLSPEQAAAFYKLDPRSRQQVLENLGSQKQQKQTQEGFAKLDSGQDSQPKEIDPDLVHSLLEADVSDEELNQLLNTYAKPEGDEKEVEKKEPAPRFTKSPSEAYKRARQAGLSEKDAEALKSAAVGEFKIKQKELGEWESSLGKERDLNTKITNLNRVVELVKRGNLPPSAVGRILDTLDHGVWGFGINLKDLAGADAEELDKIAKSFILGGKNYFPGRMTDFDAKTYLGTFPGLGQSDEAKLRNANIQMIMAQAEKLWIDGVKKLKSEHGGKLPDNAQEIIEFRIGGKLDDLYEKMTQGLSEIPGYEEELEKARVRQSKDLPGALVGGVVGGILGGGPIGMALGAAGGSAIGSYAGRGIQKLNELDKEYVPTLPGALKNLMGLNESSKR